MVGDAPASVVFSLPVVGVGVLAGAGEFGLSGLVGSSGILASQTTSSSSHLQSHQLLHHRWLMSPLPSTGTKQQTFREVRVVPTTEVGILTRSPRLR
jgi:hypothetical protein